jgi:hypothetical protein
VFVCLTSGAQDGHQCGAERIWIVSAAAVRDRHRGEHQPRTQRFCRTPDRFGVTYRFPVGENTVKFQLGKIPA